MYHYTESGLRNIWLANGFNRTQTPYGTAVAIEDVDGLHQAIGNMLVTKSGRLTGTEFRFLRKEQDLSQRSLADLIGCTSQQILRWETGKTRLPKWADRIGRVIYRECIEGNVQIREFVDRLNKADAEAHARKREFVRDGHWAEAA